MAATYTLDMSDADGNLLSETDSRLAGVNVDYQYTPEGQTSVETLTNAGTPLSSQGYTYDQSTGLLTNAAVNGQTFNYTYIVFVRPSASSKFVIVRPSASSKFPAGSSTCRHETSHISCGPWPAS